MNRAFILLIIAASLWSCSKSSDNIIWERSFGPGKALYVKATGDSGFVSCGESGGKQYLLFLDKEKNKVLEYNPDIPGFLNSAWTGNDYFIAAGSTAGKMYLSKIDVSGTVLWDSVFTNSFIVENTSLCYLGGGNFLAIGSANPDSAITTPSGLSYVWFNTEGTISSRADSVYTSYIAVKGAVADNSGNVFLALTRMGTGGKTKAVVAKYNTEFQKIFEKDLSNNPLFGAASLGLALDNNGNAVITGRTELPVSSGKENNAFVVRYFFNKDSITRKYLEYANSGSSIIPDGAEQFIVLNQNCLIVNIIDQDINIAGIIRTYKSCDPKSGDSFGYSIDIGSDGNIIMAGSKGNSYYLTIKSSTALSPV
jgi:hypothetical protein